MIPLYIVKNKIDYVTLFFFISQATSSCLLKLVILHLIFLVITFHNDLNTIRHVNMSCNILLLFLTIQLKI